ncbi:family 1 encapsulin nanocompartment shell protein [Thiococcus pfennigii]|uniref:family 1 encapsulin nanocompartment shell protein n=1 Tax=Thiococcus pfennigii TaxID=1057 RepID=UPI001904B999|nr:family 1 encapsulin nanocompartment shell protein [Thiococcus pfennigii]MBK1701287.1 bacteriocin [Thiococcus pfennigii]MBK1730316.1 bacteriocin [Thiococcus pfennigii]
MSYLNRDAASFPAELWTRIDAAAIGAARDRLTARRFLDLEGPFGIGLTSVEIGDEAVVNEPDGELAGTVGSRSIPVPMLQQPLALSIRRVEGHLRLGLPLDLRPVEAAAEAIARREEQVIYQGIPELGLEGLMTANGRSSVPCGDWSEVEQAIGDVLAAVNRLDANGYVGPYALALSPVRYNALFRRYQCSDMLQLDHLQRLCEAGLFKAPIDGAVLVDARVGDIKIGQDIQVGYSSNDGTYFRLVVSESLVFMLDEPEAICTLEE